MIAWFMVLALVGAECTDCEVRRKKNLDASIRYQGKYDATRLKLEECIEISSAKTATVSLAAAAKGREDRSSEASGHSTSTMVLVGVGAILLGIALGVAFSPADDPGVVIVGSTP